MQDTQHVAPEVEATDADAVVTIAAPADPKNSIVIRGVEVSYSDTPAGGTLSIVDGAGEDSTLDFRIDVDSKGSLDVPLPEDGLKAPPGREVVVTLSGGGTGVVGRVNVGYDVEY